MNARSSRLLRGSLAAGLTTMVAAVLHVAAGGEAPSAPALLTAFVVAGLLASAVSGRESLWRLSVAVAAAQIAFHTSFSLLGTTGMAGRAAGSFDHVGHSAQPGLGVEFVAAADHHGQTAAVVMILFHVIAAALTVMLLQRCGMATRSYSESLSRFVARLRESFVVLVPLRDAKTPVRTARPLKPWARVLSSSLRYRGPPAAI